MLRIILTVIMVLCPPVAGIGAIVCLMGYEAYATGLNPRPWIMAFASLVVAPSVVFVTCLISLIILNRKRHRVP